MLLMPATIVPILAAADYAEQTTHAGRTLREGGIVVLPTDTMYGIAARLTHDGARARLRALRPELAVRPLTIHLAGAAGVTRFVGDIPSAARTLMRKLWPGPVGLIFSVEPDRQQEVAAELDVAVEELYENGQITLRCPDHPVALDVLRTAGDVPIVLTQAPTMERTPAHRAREVAPAIVDAADLTLDAGPTRYNKPSTLVRILSENAVGGPRGGYEVVRAGVYDERTIARMSKTTLLFVCSGNTCRSPMAMALARKIMAEKLGTTEAGLEAKGVSVISAGAYAMTGSRATPYAADAVKSLGADLSAHRSRPLTTELVNSADAVYTMSRSHQAAVLSLAPQAADKVFTLDPAGDIDDPIGSDSEVYRTLAVSLEKLIRARLDERVFP